MRIIIILTLVVSFSAFSQSYNDLYSDVFVDSHSIMSKFEIKDLKNNVWVYVGKEIAHIVFTDTEMNSYWDGTRYTERKYYLSDTIISLNNYDVNKVGNSKIGKYIVTEKGSIEIIKFTNTSFSFKSHIIENNSNVLELFSKDCTLVDSDGDSLSDCVDVD